MTLSLQWQWNLTGAARQVMPFMNYDLEKPGSFLREIYRGLSGRIRHC